MTETVRASHNSFDSSPSPALVSHSGSSSSVGEPPRYAVVKLKNGDDVFKLFKLLLEQGYSDVSFVHSKKGLVQWAAGSKSAAASSLERSRRSSQSENQDRRKDHGSSDSSGGEMDSNSDTDSNMGVQSASNNASGGSSHGSGEGPSEQQFDSSHSSSLSPTLPASHNPSDSRDEESAKVNRSPAMTATSRQERMSPARSAQSEISGPSYSWAHPQLPIISQPHQYPTSGGSSPMDRDRLQRNSERQAERNHQMNSSALQAVLAMTTRPDYQKLAMQSQVAQAMDASMAKHLAATTSLAPGFRRESSVTPPYSLSSDQLNPKVTMAENGFDGLARLSGSVRASHPNPLPPFITPSMAAAAGYGPHMGTRPLLVPRMSTAPFAMRGSHMFQPNHSSYGPRPVPMDILGRPVAPHLSQAQLGMKRKLSEEISQLTTPATTQLRQRGSRAQCDDPNVFVACKLCQNKIMASRLSNLTNHVRRHSTLKQFQCCYCDYTHNEMAKVRLHMLHNHKDKDSQPIDNLSPEMQAAWDILMQQCFPDHYNGNNAPKSAPAPQQQSQMLEKPITANQEDPRSAVFRGAVPCTDCGQMVAVKDRLEHIHRFHLNCSPYVCSACAYEHTDQGNVMLHIALKHLNVRSARVFTRDTLTIAEALIPKYFPVHLFKVACSEMSVPKQARSASPDFKPSHMLDVPVFSPPINGHQSHSPAAHKSQEITGSDQSNGASSADPRAALELLPKSPVLTRPIPTLPALPPVQPTNLEEASASNSLPPVYGLASSGLARPLATYGSVSESFEQTFMDNTGGSHTENLRCLLCRKVLEGVRPLSSLLNHAKRHYHLKQFKCVQCPYSSSEAAHVRNHIKLKHRSCEGKAPLDNRSPSLQAAWMHTMVRCFPGVAPRLKKFRFKNFRNKPSGRPKSIRTQLTSRGNRHNTDATTTSKDTEGESGQDSGENDDSELADPNSPQVDVCGEEKSSDDNSEDSNNGLISVFENEKHSNNAGDSSSRSIDGDGSSSDSQDQQDSPRSSNKGSSRNSPSSAGTFAKMGRKACRLCGFSCSTREEQTQHASVHVPVKPFRCSICQYRTTEYQQLRAHLWKHKLIGGDRQKAHLKEGIAEMAEANDQYLKLCFGTDE